MFTSNHADSQTSKLRKSSDGSGAIIQFCMNKLHGTADPGAAHADQAA